MSLLPGSLPLGPFRSLSLLGEGFFQSLHSFCLFLSARVFRLCIPYAHAAHSPSLSCYLKTLDPCFSEVSVVRGIFPSLSFPFRHIVFLLFNPERPKKHVISMTFWLIVSVSLRLQLYGEYREQLGNFARREAARLLTERQWRRQAGETAATARKGHGRRHHHHHPATLESHHSLASSTKKPRTYSKCQGEEFTCSNAHIHML